MSTQTKLVPHSARYFLVFLHSCFLAAIVSMYRAREKQIPLVIKFTVNLELSEVSRILARNSAYEDQMMAYRNVELFRSLLSTFFLLVVLLELSLIFLLIFKYDLWNPSNDHEDEKILHLRFIVFSLTVFSVLFSIPTAIMFAQCYGSTILQDFSVLGLLILGVIWVDLASRTLFLYD